MPPPDDEHSSNETEPFVVIEEDPSLSSGVVVKSRKQTSSSLENEAAEATTPSTFSARNILLLGGLGAVVLLYLTDFGSVLNKFGGGGNSPAAPQGGGGFHAPSFGGSQNIGHPGGVRAYLSGDFAYEEIFVPVSNVGHAVPSLSPENVLNFMGHYVHDEHRSPYASHLYGDDKNASALEEEQKKFVAKMEEVRKKWGAWDFRDDDDYSDTAGDGERRRRPAADFGSARYKDLPAADFPSGSWQTDPTYVRNFLAEAKALIDRVKEGIYAEYGQPTLKPDGTSLTPEEVLARDKNFAVARGPGEDRAGKVAWLNPNAWDALVRKLLHGMMTNDEFYVVLGGHSAAAGHGNNFHQTKMMAFHYLMEPIFDKLGMRLISRNMAQGGVGTTHSAFASGSIYGEKDLLFWDSAMTEGWRSPGAHDVFNKQAILGGERVPVLMNCPPEGIAAESNGTAWLGGQLLDIYDGESNKKPNGMQPSYTTSDTQAEQDLPFAARYMYCEGAVGPLCKAHKYDAVCWVERSDCTPTAAQNKGVGGQAGWHPGTRAHQLSARVMSLVVLHAMDDAIERWTNRTEAGEAPLADEHWHVGNTYKNVQEKVRTHISATTTAAAEGGDDGAGAVSACEKLFPSYPRVCRVTMRGFGEWTPRRLPDESMLRSILKPAPNGYVPHLAVPSEYAGITLLPWNQRVPYGDVDVHAIAIASTVPPPSELDHAVKDEEERRMLARASTEAARRRTERANEAYRKRRVRRRSRRSLAEVDDMQVALSSSSAHRKDADGDGAATEKIVPGRGWHATNLAQHFCDGSYSSECGRNKGNTCLQYGSNDGRGSYQGDGLSGWLVMTVPNVKEGLILLRMEWWIGAKSNPRTQGWTEVNGGQTDAEEPKYVFPELHPETVNATTTTGDDSRRFFVRRLSSGSSALRSNGDDSSSSSESLARSAPESSSSSMAGLHLDSDGYWEIDPEDSSRRRRRLKAPPAPQPDDLAFDIAINGKIVKTMDKTEFMSWGKAIVQNFALWPLMDDVEWAKREWGDRDGEDVEVAVRLRCPSDPRQCRAGVSHVYYA